MKIIISILVITSFSILGSAVYSQSISEIVNRQLSALVAQDALNEEDTDWEITSNHTSAGSGVQHIYYLQQLKGIPVFGTDSRVHLLPNGEILIADNQFINNSVEKVTNSSPVLNPIKAIEAVAAQLNYHITEELSVVKKTNTTNTEFLMSDGGISLNPIPVKLMYFLTATDELLLVWDLSIRETDGKNWWSLRVNASTGRIVDQNNYTVYCASEESHRKHNSAENFNNPVGFSELNEFSESTNPGCTECYEVFALPIESPFYGSRTIEIQPAFPAASPFGWHDTDGIAGAEFTTTRGNNVDAFEDGDNPGYHPDGGPSLNFTGYPFSEIYTVGNQYEDASITNLFYISNIVHDIAYLYGFDEASGNFQTNNYGNGGIANDYLIAQGQDGAGTCGANMSTPPDGISPIMQMTICGDKDGDYENFILIHEYTHGVSNRLTGGAGNTGCLNNMEQMGEGWSDFYGIALTIEPGDAGTDERDVGTYLFGVGIREYPYSTDFTVNPQTYDFIKTSSVPHGVGSVWASMVWEMTWALIDTYGFDPDVYNFNGDITQDGGNVMALALVTEAFKLQPCGPGFVDGRDAILAADQAIYGGANECLIWEAFARRGLGWSANQGSSNSITDGTEAFDIPVVCNLGFEEIEFERNILLYPNPSDGRITVVNNSSQAIQSVTITDLNSRVIYALHSKIAGDQLSFSIDGFTNGMYFVKIETEEFSVIKRIIKK
jgi:extracellular elastinolytic metalloproteinase